MGFRSKLQAGVVLGALNVLAATAFTVLVMTSADTVGYILAGLTLVAVAVHGRQGFGPTIPAQLLVATGLLITYHDKATQHTTPMVLAAVMLALVVAEQPLLDLIISRPVIRVANLPGYRPETRFLVPPRALYTANLPLIAVVGVFAVASWPVWPLVAVIAVVAALAAVVGAQAVRLRLRGSWTEKQFRSAMEQHNPAFALYFSAPDETEYHVQMWLPYIERHRQAVGHHPARAVRVRHASPRRRRTPVVYCPLVATVDEVVTPEHEGRFLRQQRREEQPHGAVQPADSHPVAARRQ